MFITMFWLGVLLTKKTEGKYQWSIQSSTTPDSGYYMGKW